MPQNSPSLPPPSFLPKANSHIGLGSLPSGLFWVVLPPAFNPNTWEAEASASEFTVSLIYRASLPVRTAKAIYTEGPCRKKAGDVTNTKAENTCLA